MMKYLLRLILTVGVGFSCYCFSNPAMPHRLLTQYVQRYVSANSESTGELRRDIVLANAAIRFLEEQHGVNANAKSSGFSPAPNADLRDAFFSEEDPYANPSVLSEVKMPFGSQAADMRYAPIETGPVVQSNPYLQ